MRGLFAFAITDQACWLAILLFAFNRGGIGEVGWVALLLLAGAATHGDAPAAQSDRCESPAAIASTVG